MTPVVQLYWLRFALGIIAAVLSSIVAFYLGTANDISILVDCVTIALVVYLASYYALRPIFRSKIEKQSKILSTGIFMYFFAWLPFFVLFYTMIRIFV
jgi:membrane protein YdbS with pleckstrin-like domain